MTDIGYKTEQRCDVCHVVNECQIEPRFGYVVCVNHRNVNPLKISLIKEKPKEVGRSQL